jgi:hypothetical protein
VFMTNHLHLLATPATERSAGRTLQAVGRRGSRRTRSPRPSFGRVRADKRARIELGIPSVPPRLTVVGAKEGPLAAAFFWVATTSVRP